MDMLKPKQRLRTKVSVMNGLARSQGNVLSANTLGRPASKFVKQRRKKNGI